MLGGARKRLVDVKEGDRLHNISGKHGTVKQVIKIIKILWDGGKETSVPSSIIEEDGLIEKDDE